MHFVICLIIFLQLKVLQCQKTVLNLLLRNLVITFIQYNFQLANNFEYDDFTFNLLLVVVVIDETIDWFFIVLLVIVVDILVGDGDIVSILGLIMPGLD